MKNRLLDVVYQYQIKMLIIKRIFLFMVLFSPNVLMNAQVRITFNQETKSITTDALINNWKSGKMLEVYIKNYHSTTFTYKIVYSSKDIVNDDGLVTFKNLTAVNKISPYTVTPDELFLSLPIEGKDYSQIKITEFSGTTQTDEQVYTFRVHGGIKFDVSSGFFATSLRDESYVLVNRGDSSDIVSENTGNFRGGVGILAHIHTRWHAIVNFGASGGFEINNESKVGYLAGGSFLLGLDQKFIFTFGIELSQRQIKTNAYKDVTKVPNSVTTVPLVSIWGDGPFLALTYNF